MSRKIVSFYETFYEGITSNISKFILEFNNV